MINHLFISKPVWDMLTCDLPQAQTVAAERLTMALSGYAYDDVVIDDGYGHRIVSREEVDKLITSAGNRRSPVQEFAEAISDAISEPKRKASPKRIPPIPIEEISKRQKLSPQQFREWESRQQVHYMDNRAALVSMIDYNALLKERARIKRDAPGLKWSGNTQKLSGDAVARETKRYKGRPQTAMYWREKPLGNAARKD